MRLAFPSTGEVLTEQVSGTLNGRVTLERAKGATGEELRELLGAELVAFLGGVKKTRAVRQWAEGTPEVSGVEDLRRLRLAYQAARKPPIALSQSVVYELLDVFRAGDG